MTFLVTPGSAADLVLEVRDRAGVLQDVYSVSYAIFDRDGASVTSGDAEWESQGTYVAFWTVSDAATIGHRYKVVFTVTVTNGGRVEKVPFTVEIAGVSL